jgi:hypothetical protein
VIRDKNGTSMVIFSSGLEPNRCGRVLALYTSRPGIDKEVIATAQYHFAPRPEDCH